jgi:hypothetical protein
VARVAFAVVNVGSIAGTMVGVAPRGTTGEQSTVRTRLAPN